jgi:hypothetical protein
LGNLDSIILLGILILFFCLKLGIHDNIERCAWGNGETHGGTTPGW